MTLYCSVALPTARDMCSNHHPFRTTFLRLLAEHRSKFAVSSSSVAMLLQTSGPRGRCSGHRVGAGCCRRAQRVSCCVGHVRANVGNRTYVLRGIIDALQVVPGQHPCDFFPFGWFRHIFPPPGPHRPQAISARNVETRIRTTVASVVEHVHTT